MTAQHLQAHPAPILYNTSEGFVVIEEGFSLYGFRIFRIYRTNGDFSVYYPQIFDVSAPDRRAHMEGFPPLFIEIGETIINHHTGPNIRGVIEYVSFSVGGEFYQTNPLTTSK